MTTSVNASLSRASSPESAGAAVVPSTSRSHVPNRREGYVMLFDSVQNTWVRVYLAVHDATVMHVLHTAGRYGRMVRPSLSLAKVSHVYCSADIPGVVDKHALLLVLYAASAHDLLCLRLQDKRLFGEWFQGLSTLWPETVTVSPIEELVKLKSLISPGLHSYLFGTSQTAAGAGSSTFQREGSSVKHMQQHSAARMASLSATCPRRMIGGGGLLSAASTVNHHHSNVAGAFVAGMHGGYHRQPSLLFAKKQHDDGVDSSLILSNSGHFTTNGSGSTTARRFADPNQKASLPIPPPSTSPLPVGRGSYATSSVSKSHYGSQKENQHVPMTSRVASSSTMRKQQASHHLRPSSSSNNNNNSGGGGGDGKIFRTVVDKGYGVAYPSPSPLVPTRTSTATPAVSARSSQERSTTTVEPSHHSERRQEENSTAIERQKDCAVESTAAPPGVEVDSCSTKPTPEAAKIAAASAPSLAPASSVVAEEKQAGRTLADVVAPLPASFAESRAELQARLVDLEIENVTLSANVLELESTVEQLRSTVSEWRRKHSSLEQQLAVQEKHFAQKYEEEKEQLRAALMEEVKSQFCAAKEKWDAREAEYRFQIETLTGAAPPLPMVVAASE